MGLSKILLLGSLLPFCLNAQVKFEREFRVRSNEVHPEAVIYVNSFAFTKKIKWYREESMSGASIEAKTCFDGRRYSLEFDTTGVLEDIEVEVRFSALRQDVRTAIEKSFDGDFKRWKIRKVQRQFSGEPNAVRQAALADVVVEGVIIRYEIVVKGLKDKTELFEYTFDQSGQLISVKLIVLAPTDNLEY